MLSTRPLTTPHHHFFVSLNPVLIHLVGALALNTSTEAYDLLSLGHVSPPLSIPVRPFLLAQTRPPPSKSPTLPRVITNHTVLIHTLLLATLTLSSPRMSPQ